jgi:hypothetical protein
MELMGVIEHGGEMVDYFMDHDRKKGCIDLLSKLRDASPLESGSHGKVYEIVVDKKNYVVKKTPSTNYDIVTYRHNQPPVSLGELAKRFAKSRKGKRFDEHNFYLVNNGDRHTVIQPGTQYLVPFKNPLVPCKLKKMHEVSKFYYVMSSELGRYDKISTPSSFIFPKGSYVCANASYSEYAIGKILSNTKLSNFLSVDSFSMCSDATTTFDYTFMEKIDGTVYDLKTKVKNLNAEMIESVLVQSLFAISFMNRKFMIQHNDLHLRNLGYKRIGKKSKLLDFDYFSYLIDGVRISFPNVGFLVKVFDFGLASKFSSPIIANSGVVDGKITNIIPMWRDDSYDLLTFMYSMYVHFHNISNLVTCLFAKLLTSSFANKFTFTRSTTDASVKDADYIVKILLPLFFKPQQIGRSTFVGLELRAWDLLTDKDIFPDKPKGKLLGKIDSYHSEYYDRQYNANLHVASSQDAERLIHFLNHLPDFAMAEVSRHGAEHSLVEWDVHITNLCVTAHTPQIYNALLELVNLVIHNPHLLHFGIVLVYRCMNCIVYKNLSQQEVKDLVTKVTRLLRLEYVKKDESSIERIVYECIRQVEQRA